MTTWTLGRLAGLSATLLSASILTLASAGAAFADTWPVRQIHLVAPYPPGASTDVVARLVGQQLTTDLGQAIVIENRSGASGNVGSDYVARSAPDGYNLLLATDATVTSNPHLFRNFPFDVFKDLTPITLAVQNVIVLVANPNFPPNNIHELIDYAKAHPGGVSFGTPGQGSPHHMAGAMLNQMAGIQLQHVPYRGGGPAAVDVLSGQIPLSFSSLVTVDAYIKAGKLKVLGVTDKGRFAGLPDVPAIGETLKGYEMSSWLAFYGPPNLPAPIVTRLHESIVKALKLPDITAKLNAQGLAVVAGTPAQLTAQQRSDFDKRAVLIKSIGITLE